ncbi:type II toxin-antitoxin system RelE/ParE family toxin [Luteimonas sp. Y-2-2-4F]|nr:type II toxin-antitoxin system RelE/ParE family toxin [Luteimonas sp. Y-2-2-4F]MCD9030893.1 type II toxin-antitoxin system RelE/ParE family toxin [Luteimonas sp. Y-2-2-4F]
MATIRTTEIFDSWFERLRDRAARMRITARIRRLSEGNPGQHRNLTNGVTEMKIDYGPGYRVYFVTRAGVTYLLLCGGDKTTQQHDIRTALELAGRV